MQAHCTNKDKSEQALQPLDEGEKRYMEAVRATWLRLFIAHESKQRQKSEPNRKTHLKNSVKRIRSITSELSVMEANKLTAN